MSVTPEITEIEARAAEGHVDMAVVLKRANVANTTWWRWSQGHFEPRMSTLRKVRDALETELASRDEGSAAA